MADLLRTGLNNQKRFTSVAVCDTLATSATMDDDLFSLPVNSLITDIKVVVETISGTVTDTVDIKAGATVIANECVVGTIGVKGPTGGFAPVTLPTGGIISVVAGVDAPDTAGRIRIVVEYIELDTTSGLYVG